MQVTYLTYGNPSNQHLAVLDEIVHLLSPINKLLSDRETKPALQSLTGASHPKMKFPGLRMDAVVNGVGVVCVMGNMATIGTRCFSSLFHANDGKIREQIFVTHAPCNAWMHEYKKGDKIMTRDNGNRTDSKYVKDMLDEIHPNLMKVPVSIISLQDHESYRQYHQFFRTVPQEPRVFP
jgi:hypothetical protein